MAAEKNDNAVPEEHEDTGAATPTAPERGEARDEVGGETEASRLALERLARERDEDPDDLKRERAAFLNHKRWVARERESWETAAVCRFLEKLMPFLDDMERALQAAESASDLDSLRDGFEMICSRFRETLEAAGVEEVPSDGEPFDPRHHEAILQVEDPARPPGTVLETTHRGFLLKDRLIRAAKVIVSRGSSPVKDEEGRKAVQTDTGSAEDRREGHEEDRTTTTDPGEGA